MLNSEHILSDCSLTNLVIPPYKLFVRSAQSKFSIMATTKNSTAYAYKTHVWKVPSIVNRLFSRRTEKEVFRMVCSDTQSQETIVNSGNFKYL